MLTCLEPPCKPIRTAAMRREVRIFSTFHLATGARFLKMSKLFVIQNDTHAKNFAVMAREAISCGEQVSIVVLDGVTHERTEQYLGDDLRSRIVRVEPNARPFYRSPSWHRVQVCARVRVWARTAIGVFDRVFIGNDGALQKVIVKAARSRNSRCRVTMILDGLLTRERGWTALAKRRLQRTAEWLGVDEFVPSTVGVSHLLDEIVVMHVAVADVLDFHGVRKTAIRVAPLPRHVEIQRTARRQTAGKSRILFLGSAYLWHGERAGHELQVADFNEFVKFAGRSADFECRLRIHPRDDVANYPRMTSAHIAVSAGSTSLEDDLAWADIVVASRSSGLFDATLAGRRAYVYAAHFSVPTEDAFLRSLPAIQCFEELGR